ncbi:MAG: hypothetical protein HRU05_11475 [Oceanospirillaceae bacterium]|nr:hypothetical protein [Oceanospirillaceae bacterium]
METVLGHINLECPSLACFFAEFSSGFADDGSPYLLWYWLQSPSWLIV